MCASDVSPPALPRPQDFEGRVEELADGALVALLQTAKRLSADYRRYLRHGWPNDAETLSARQLAFCMDELVLIVKNLARIVARLGSCADSTAPTVELLPYQTMLAGRASKSAGIPATVAQLSEDTRALYLRTLRLACLPQ